MKNQNIKTENEITLKSVSVDKFLKVAGQQILKVFDSYEFDNFSDN